MQTFLSTVEDFWSSHLNCPAAALSRPGVHVSAHGEALADYAGALLLFRGAAVTVSLPRSALALAAEVEHADPAALRSPPTLASVFSVQPGSVIGPAWLGYVDAAAFRPMSGAARLLHDSDSAAAAELEGACTADEWAHGGSPVAEQPAAGVFEGDRLVALAGYEVWGDRIAHIAVVTHPGARGRGRARQAVSRITEHALGRGLVPQYRTLEANRPSLWVAHALGFSSFGSTIAVRLGASGG